MDKPSRFWQSQTPERRLRILKSTYRNAKCRYEAAREDGSESEIEIARAEMTTAQRHLANEKQRQAEAQAKEQARRTARTHARRARKKRSEARKAAEQEGSR